MHLAIYHYEAFGGEAPATLTLGAYFLSAFILQKNFSIPTDSLLLLFIRPYKELRDFCNFSKIPGAPLLTRFKQGFKPYIELIFQRMVDYTESIYQAIDASLAQILTFDTSEI